MDIEHQLEAILFFKAEAVSYKKLAEILAVDIATVQAGLTKLEQSLSIRSLALMQTADEVMLVTRPEVSKLIEQLVKDDLHRDIGKAGLETLTIILYKGPIARRDIDYIRGVNSQFILRNLLIRGLIEKITSEHDQRSFLYQPSLELLGYLGVTKREDLPEFAKVQEELAAFIKKEEASENSEKMPENEPR